MAEQPPTAGFQVTAPAGVTCHICGEALTGTDSALCSVCDRPFHLRAREDSDGTDCGAVWMNQQWLTLEFACNECLGKGEKEPAVGQGH